MNVKKYLIGIFSSYLVFVIPLISVKPIDNFSNLSNYESIEYENIACSSISVVPVAPTNFRVTYIGTNSVDLAWTNTHNDNLPLDAKIVDENVTFVDLGRNEINEGTYSINSLLPQTSYINVHLVTYYGFGVSTYSNEISFRTLNNPDSSLSSGSITLIVINTILLLYLAGNSYNRYKK